MDRRPASYRQLCMGRKYIVERYIEQLEALYIEYKIGERATDLTIRAHKAKTEEIRKK